MQFIYSLLEEVNPNIDLQTKNIRARTFSPLKSRNDELNDSEDQTNSNQHIITISADVYAEDIRITIPDNL
ncbi:hypothetical protein OnM2_073065 [Erysiphe neolycopersici]|uniref:Uncharacterized protein n=1 Tax=Erysiphe neolycopersici TaxID=212602 RepID=A0A420HJI4_9PEZI|nr:hypothetical protein OnM2_073065 [Erysiphe neolycopersici]